MEGRKNLNFLFLGLLLLDPTATKPQLATCVETFKILEHGKLNSLSRKLVVLTFTKHQSAHWVVITNQWHWYICKTFRSQ